MLSTRRKHKLSSDQWEMTSVLKIEHSNDHKNECDDVSTKNRNRMMTWQNVKDIYRNRIDVATTQLYL